jgi:hypothetical protein
MPSLQQTNLAQLFERAPYLALWGLALSVGSFMVNGREIAVGAAAMFLAGFACVGMLIFIGRSRLPPVLSWTILILLSVFLLLGTFDMALGALLVEGALSVLSAIAILFGFSGLAFFGSLFVFRQRLLQWLA